MTRFCVDLRPGRPRAGVALLAALVALAPVALPQEAAPDAGGAPTALGPPQPLTPPARSEVPGTLQPSYQPGYQPGYPSGYQPAYPPVGQAPAAAQPAAEPEAKPLKGGISVDTLGEIDSNTVGVLDAGSGGLGINMWRGTPADLVHRLLARLRRPAALPAARGLARRLLLTAARPPQGAWPKEGPSLLAQRLGRLLAFGDLASVNALLRVVPAHVDEEAVARARMNAAFLSNDKGGACNEARAAVGRYSGIAWRKALVFCEHLAGEGARASIGAGLLSEQGVKDDAFFSLVAILGGDKAAGFTVPARATPLHLAMMRAAGVQISETLADTAETGVLRAMAFSPNAALDTRLEAAERTEDAGVLEAETLRQIYAGMTFTPGDIQNAAAGAGNFSGPRGRALLYQAARGETRAPARAELIAKAFVLARSEGRIETAVRAFQPLLEEIPPSADLAWFAAEAAKALYFAGGADVPASRWAELAFARPYVPGTGPRAGAGTPPAGGAASTEVSVWPFAAVARLPVAPPPAKAMVPPSAAPAQAGMPPSATPAPAPAPAGMPGTAPGTREGTGAAAATGATPPPDFASIGAGSARVAPPPKDAPTAADALAGVRRVQPQPLVELITQGGSAAAPAAQAPAPAGPATAAVPATPAAAPAAPAPPFEDVMFDRWRKVQAGLAGEVTAQRRAAMLLGLLDALGSEVPQQAWIESSGAVREMAALPPPGLMRALDDAARGGRLGETILLVLAVLGPDEPDKLHPSVAGAAVRALVAAGLPGEARALALQVAFGAGL